MIRIVGVRYREGCKVYNFDAGEIDLVLGDTVIVDSEQGVGAATVACDVVESERPPSGKPLKRVLRKAREDDFRRLDRNAELESESFRVCQQKILEREMIMKLVRVEWAFDNSKATFYFTADGRVDFRDLVKDLAYRFKIRIEMRQIGVRDEAKMLGGYGPCGRPLCCSTFLKDFEPVSIRMAKKQDLVLNPAKISGICGRLMCCLGYEYSFYDEAKKDAKRKKAQEAEAAAAAIAEGGEAPAVPAPAEGVAPAGQRPGTGRGPRRRGPKQPQSGRPGGGQGQPGQSGQQGQPGQPGQRSQGGRPERPERQGDRPPQDRRDRPQAERQQGRPQETPPQAGAPPEPGVPGGQGGPGGDEKSDKARRKRSAWRKNRRRGKGEGGGEGGGGGQTPPPDKPSGGQ
ncbi:MAG: stage 0 sporulation protein [Nitrospirae bacterium]|nr:stage 0 sporulation protein [Nitrospirota bacterium]MBI5696772.1 stage 0 sporulation protein [Nitrospirota bacterium]